MAARRWVSVSGLVALTALAGFMAPEQFNKVTDRIIQYQAETYKGQLVEMSCRFSPLVEKFETGQFDDRNSVMFQTEDYKVEVIIEKRHKDVVKEIQQLTSGEEITVYGKAYKYPAGEPYVVIHKFTRGFTTEYAAGDQKVITLYVNGATLKMERGKTYSHRTPKSQELVELKWE